MTTFADFAFYRDEFHGLLSETEYTASVESAHAEILLQTNGRASSAPESMQRAVKLCECALVDVIHGYKQTAADIPKGVTSVSNDSFSISSGIGGGLSLVQAETQERAAVCARFLLRPVNLMCRWL